MTTATAIPTLDATDLRPFVAAHRAEELPRFDSMIARYGIERWTAEALSRELFGMPLHMVLGAAPEELALDWRDDAFTRRRLAGAS